MGVANASMTGMTAPAPESRGEFVFRPAQDGPFQDKTRTSRSFFSPFRQIFQNSNTASEKLLSNVKIFPNPVAEQINLSFRLDKQADVSIKVMDALGNEVVTLLNQQLESGNQNHTFETHNKMTKGFYFIRVSANTETVVKRISVL